MSTLWTEFLVPYQDTTPCLARHCLIKDRCSVVSAINTAPYSNLPDERIYLAESSIYRTSMSYRRRRQSKPPEAFVPPLEQSVTRNQVSPGVTCIEALLNQFIRSLISYYSVRWSIHAIHSGQSRFSNYQTKESAPKKENVLVLYTPPPASRHVQKTTHL